MEALSSEYLNIKLFTLSFKEYIMTLFYKKEN